MSAQNRPLIKLYLSGEPLLHEGLFEMIEYAGARGCRTMVHTNATVLTKEMAERVLSSSLTFLVLLLRRLLAGGLRASSSAGAIRIRQDPIFCTYLSLASSSGAAPGPVRPSRSSAWARRPGCSMPS